VNYLAAHKRKCDW